jgi:transposase-like protein
MSDVKYEQYTPEFKQRVLSQYQPGIRGSGIRAVAKQFNIKDHKVIAHWLKKWDGTSESLNKGTHPNRKWKLTEENDKYVRDFVLKKNKKHEHVDYKMVSEAVKKGTGKEVSLRTIQRYGQKDYNFSSKQTSRKLTIEGLHSHFLLFFTLHCEP